MNGEIFYYHTLHSENKMLPTNEQNNNKNIKTAVDIFSEILVQMIDDMKMDNIDTSLTKNIKINNIRNLYFDIFQIFLLPGY